VSNPRQPSVYLDLVVVFDCLIEMFTRKLLSVADTLLLTLLFDHQVELLSDIQASIPVLVVVFGIVIMDEFERIPILARILPFLGDFEITDALLLKELVFGDIVRRGRIELAGPFVLIRIEPGYEELLFFPDIARLIGHKREAYQICIPQLPLAPNNN